VYHNIKPTPIGTAYPEKARVNRCAVLLSSDESGKVFVQERGSIFETFTMIRDDHEAEALAAERVSVQHRLLKSDLDIGAWPEPPENERPNRQSL